MENKIELGEGNLTHHSADFTGHPTKYTKVKHHGQDGMGADVYTAVHERGHQTALVVKSGKLVASTMEKTSAAVEARAKKAVDSKKKTYWDTPGDSWYNASSSGGPENSNKVDMHESEVVRKGKDGRTMMSAAMFLNKAKEIANKDPSKKVKSSMKGVGDDHFAQARKDILKSRGMTEEKTVKLSFKDYKQVHESVEAEIDDQIAEVTKKLEEAAFDWGKTKADVSWLHGKGDKSTTKKTDGGLKHTGTYGSETHKAPDKVGKPEEKKSVGRPAGSYGGAYKIDKGARDSKEYKDALSAKVRAAKAQGFEDRTYFKDMMNASLLQHAKNLAKKAESK